MAAMDLSESEVEATVINKTYYGSDTRELTGNQQVRMNFIGPGAEVILQEGPPAGKKWRVFSQIHISESDI